MVCFFFFLSIRLSHYVIFLLVEIHKIPINYWKKKKKITRARNRETRTQKNHTPKLESICILFIFELRFQFCYRCDHCFGYVRLNWIQSQHQQMAGLCHWLNAHHVRLARNRFYLTDFHVWSDVEFGFEMRWSAVLICASTRWRSHRILWHSNFKFN